MTAGAEHDVLLVVEAMHSMAHRPVWTSHSWTQLILDVSEGKQHVMSSRCRLYAALKLEPEVCRTLLSFLVLTARQGESLFAIHNNPGELAERREKGRGLY